METTLSSPNQAAPPDRGEEPLRKRLFASLVRLVIVLVISAVIGGGWYLAKKGFGSKTRERIVEELRKHGVEARINHLTLDPFRGLVAQGVRIYDYKRKENTLALISEIALDINYAALIHRQPFLNGIEMRDAELRLPGTHYGKGEKSPLRHFRAHIYFPPEHIEVTHADGLVCGIRVSVSGQLIKRADYKPSPPLTDEEWQKRLSIVQRTVAELQKFSYPAEHPTLQVKFSGDLAALEDAQLDAELRAPRADRAGYQLNDLSATARYADQRLTLEHCQWRDRTGTFSASANWARRTGDASFDAHSNIDLKSLMDSFGAGKLLADATFATAPKIDVSGTAKVGEDRPRFKAIGQVGIERFAYRGVELNNLHGEFSWDGERIFVHQLEVEQDKGRLRAEMLDAPNDFRLDAESTISPVVARIFLSPEMQKFLDEWQFTQPPAVQLQIRGSSDKPDTWHGTGSLALDRTRFRSAWMNNGKAAIRFGDGAVTYDDIQVTRDDGTVTGSFTYDFKHHEVRLANIRSTVDPLDATVWVDPKLPKTITPYKFRRPPTVTANGVYQFDNGPKTKIDINVDAPRGMDYVFLGKTLAFDRISSKLLFTRDYLQIIDLRGDALGGQLRGGADISLAPNDKSYRATINADKLDFPRLTDLYWGYKTAHGQLSGNYDFTGRGTDARTMNGTGRVDVANGDVFAIPVFGPLSTLIGGIVPGTGYSIARNAKASFKINNGVAHTDDLDISGKLFGMLGHGDIHFLDDKLDFEVRMEMHGAAGLLLAPMYKLFEYVGEGSLKKPDWHPKRF